MPENIDSGQEAEVLYSTAHAELSQCDASDSYILSFQGNNINFRVCELISFRKKVQKIDMEKLLASETADIEIISMPHCDRLFVLSIQEILELKDLFAGAFAMLELNSLIHKEIIRKGTLV